MSTFFYTKTHECFQIDESGQATIAITEYAVEQLGEITYVQLPEVGQRFEKGEPFGEIESVKTVSELYAPITGTVEAINTELDAQPELVNQAPQIAGWLLKMKPERPEEQDACMTEQAYQDYLENQ